MAIEWAVPVAVAVGKLLLRASGCADAADGVGDAQEAWGRLRRGPKRPDEISQVIAAQLELRLVGVTDPARAQDLTAAALDVAGLISRLADDDEAVRLAAAHPEQLQAYAMQHGGEELRRLTSEVATPLFDQILEAAAAEFAALAPSSARFVGASLTEVLRQVELIPELRENTRQILSEIRSVQRTDDGAPAAGYPRPKLIARLAGRTEAELAVQERVVRLVREFPSLTYEPGAIPPGRARADPKPTAIVLDGELEAAVQALLNLEEMGITVEESAAADRLEQLGATQRWVAVEYVPTLDEAESVEQAIEDNFQANGILVVGLDGSAIGAWVAPGSAYPITLPSQLEIRQDWPLERVVRAVLNQSFS